MSKNTKLGQLIQQMEHYVECWKQFNRYIGLARSKQFSQEDEDQFLEIKSVITQELEMILGVIDGPMPSREEIHGLISEAPSIRFLSELNEGGIKAVENKWHKIYIAWQATLGLLKAQQKQLEAQSGWAFFKRKK